MAAEGNGRPVEPVDYAKVNAVYAVLLAAVLAGARYRDDADDHIAVRELVPLGAATFALAKVIAKERIGSWVPEPFVEEEEAGSPQPRGRRMRHAVGELITCTRCLGTWSALGLVGLRVARPREGRIVASVLATAGLTDWLQAAFSTVASKANNEKKLANAPLEEWPTAERCAR